MKKGILRAFFVGGILLLVGCLNEPESTESTGKDGNIKVEYLFEKDGIKIYRFYDNGLYHYFTSNGETMTEQSTGKSTYEERIKSNYQ
jgi:hypothetical protein